MILGQVGKGRAREGHAADPLLVDGVGRDFHHGHVHARRLHLGQHGMHAQGIRRGQGRGFTVARPTVAHRAQHAHLVPGVREQAFQQIGAGGLAVGAGDAQNLDARRIRAPAGLGQTPEGLARIFMIDHAAAFGPDGRLKRGILRPAGAADHHGGPGLHGGGNETRSVLIDAGHGHKYVALPHDA